MFTRKKGQSVKGSIEVLVNFQNCYFIYIYIYMYVYNFIDTIED